MTRLRVGVVRYASVADAIEERLALGGRPRVRIGQGRILIVLRGVGATRWEPASQLTRALEMASVARAVLADDTRGALQRHARHAVVVRFEDVAAAQGCDVRATWECVIPTPER